MAAASELVRDGSPMQEARSWAGEATSSPAALLFLNLLDGFFTLMFLQLRMAEEANPLMRLAYDHSPLSFMLLKLAVVNVGVALLWSNRQSEVARHAMHAGVFLYAVIVAYHLSFLLTLLAG